MIPCPYCGKEGLQATAEPTQDCQCWNCKGKFKVGIRHIGDGRIRYRRHWEEVKGD